MASVIGLASIDHPGLCSMQTAKKAIHDYANGRLYDVLDLHSARQV